VNILHVIEFFTPAKGGPVQVAYHLCKNLAAQGHRVVLWTSDYDLEPHAYSDAPFEVRQHRTIFDRWNFYLTPTIIDSARKELANFDVVHLHDLRTFQNAAVGAFCRRMNIPYVISPHGSLPYLGFRQEAKKAFDLLAGRSLLRNAARLIAVSPIEEQQFREFGIPPEKIEMVYNGLDISEFDDLPPKGLLRHQLGIPDDALLILSLGRIHRIKGLEYLVYAFRELLNRMHNVYLVIAGPDDGDLDRLQGLVQSLGMSGHISFPGALYGEDKLAAYVDADVMVAPSRYEIFGLTAFEALMCGTPVVVTEGSASGQLLGAVDAAYLAPYGNSETLAETLFQTLTDEKRSQAMVQAGQAFVQERLQWSAIARQMAKVYCDVLQS